MKQQFIIIFVFLLGFYNAQVNHKWIIGAGYNQPIYLERNNKYDIGTSINIGLSDVNYEVGLTARFNRIRQRSTEIATSEAFNLSYFVDHHHYNMGTYGLFKLSHHKRINFFISGSIEWVQNDYWAQVVGKRTAGDIISQEHSTQYYYSKKQLGDFTNGLFPNTGGVSINTGFGFDIKLLNRFFVRSTILWDLNYQSIDDVQVGDFRINNSGGPEHPIYGLKYSREHKYPLLLNFSIQYKIYS